MEAGVPQGTLPSGFSGHVLLAIPRMQGILSYKLKVEEELIAGMSLRIQALANLNDTIDELFEKLSSADNPALLESLCPYFGVVWPSARGLGEHLVVAGGESMRGASVLEVGCGLAVPSLVAARLGARVTATDFHPDIPAFLARNVELNLFPTGALSGFDGTVEFVSWDWQNQDSPLGRFDWVIGSDILYEKQHPAPVARMLAAHCSPQGRIVLADPGRPYLQAFVDEMRGLGYGCEVSTRAVRDRPTTKDVFVLDLRK